MRMDRSPWWFLLLLNLAVWGSAEAGPFLVGPESEKVEGDLGRLEQSQPHVDEASSQSHCTAECEHPDTPNLPLVSPGPRHPLTGNTQEKKLWTIEFSLAKLPWPQASTLDEPEECNSATENRKDLIFLK